MSKTINKVQSEILLSRMQEKPAIARGFVKENKENVAEFWKRLALELNSSGPPMKNECEWKKAWNDQKRYVRKKASLNKCYERGTGGGPNRTQKLSPTEEAIYELVGMREAVEGVPHAHTFGLEELQSHNIVEEHLEVEVVAECNNTPEISQLEETISSPIINLPPTGRRYKKMSTQEVVQKELETQVELCSKVSEGVSLLSENAEQTQHNLKRLNRVLDRLNKQKSREFAELRRHNLAIERLTKEKNDEELDIMRKMLLLKQKKIDLLRHTMGRKQS